MFVYRCFDVFFVQKEKMVSSELSFDIIFIVKKRFYMYRCICMYICCFCFFAYRLFFICLFEIVLICDLFNVYIYVLYVFVFMLI